MAAMLNLLGGSNSVKVCEAKILHQLDGGGGWTVLATAPIAKDEDIEDLSGVLIPVVGQVALN